MRYVSLPIGQTEDGRGLSVVMGEREMKEDGERAKTGEEKKMDRCRDWRKGKIVKGETGYVGMEGQERGKLN